MPLSKHQRPGPTLTKDQEQDRITLVTNRTDCLTEARLLEPQYKKNTAQRKVAFVIEC